MARVKKSQRAAARGEWVPSTTRSQRYKRRPRGRMDPEERALRAIDELPGREDRARGRRLVGWVSELAPGLLNQHLVWQTLARVPWPALRGRRPRVPTLHSAEQLTRLLIERYELPPVLLQPFSPTGSLGHRRHRFARLASHMGGGGSFREALELGLLPASCTRRHFREFLNSTAPRSIPQAWRRAQARAEGAPEWAVEAVLRLERLCPQHRRSWSEEPWFQQTLRWLARHGEGKDLGLVLDYLRDHRPSLTGRTFGSLQRLAEAWQLETLHRLGGPPPAAPPFPSAGLVVLFPPEHEAWSLRELVQPLQLWQEGRRMSHCVWSYRDRVAQGQTSIWSLACRGQPRLTLELENRTRRLKQVKGYKNRAPTEEEQQVLASARLCSAEEAAALLGGG